MMECAKDQGQLIGSFSEALLIANAYRGELLGLIAIHLILLSINRMHSNLSTSNKVVLDYLGALKRVTYSPPYRVLFCCQHSDILKNILANLRGLSFTTFYSHLKAHNDDSVSFAKLSRKAQLNCI